jgi:hypothetical protein
MCGAACSATAPPHPGVETQVAQVQAHIEDLGGNPASMIVADVCGTNICLFAETDAQGNLLLTANNDALDDVRLLYGDGGIYVKMGAPFPTPGGTVDYGDINAVRLPAAAQGAQIGTFTQTGCLTTMSTMDLSQGDVTLSLAADTDIHISIIDNPEPAQRTFRSVTFRPADGTFPAVDPALNLEVFYGMAPYDMTFCPAAKMTVPNPDPGNWAAGAAVEFYLHGTKTFDHNAPYGGWAKVADGAVSSDGSMVSTNDGAGIPEVGLIGLKLAP